MTILDGRISLNSVQIFLVVLGVVDMCHLLLFEFAYRISSYSFRGNYSFLNLEIQRSQYIRPMVTVHKCEETIQGRRKLFNYMKKYCNFILPSTR